MSEVVLQSGGTNTALMEVLLLLITMLLAVIGWGARRGFNDLKEKLETANSQRRQNRDDIDDHSYMLYGADRGTWNGVYNELKKNRRGLIVHRDILRNHTDRLDKHGQALREEDMIQDTTGDGTDPDDLRDLQTIGNDAGDS